MRLPRSKGIRVVLLVVAALVVAVCALTVPLFIKPDLNTPVRSDAIIVLGGNGAPPEDTGIGLALGGYAPYLVFSLEPTQHCAPSTRKSVRVLCFHANPLTTQGEARSIAHLANQYHWHRIIVVMPTTQATRARLRIGRCYPGQILEVGAPPQGFWAWVRGITYEWGALLKAIVLQPSC
jgi:hypothetical protein